MRFDSGPEVFVHVNRNYLLSEYVLHENDCIAIGCLYKTMSPPTNSNNCQNPFFNTTSKTKLKPLVLNHNTQKNATRTVWSAGRKSFPLLSYTGTPHQDELQWTGRKKSSKFILAKFCFDWPKGFFFPDSMRMPGQPLDQQTFVLRSCLFYLCLSWQGLTVDQNGNHKLMCYLDNSLQGMFDCYVLHHITPTVLRGIAEQTPKIHPVFLCPQRAEQRHTVEASQTLCPHHPESEEKYKEREMVSNQRRDMMEEELLGKGTRKGKKQNSKRSTLFTTEKTKTNIIHF